MKLTTIPDVELMTVGMKWPTAGGEITFRFDHLADAVRAANEDPFIRDARVKIGHEDPRFADGELPSHDPFYDGEPALGWIENLRLENKGAVAVGDLVLPEWLGEVAPWAYPNRSVEGAYIDGRWAVETPGGKKYSFVLTAVSLLGVFRPAVEDLPDLKAFLTEGDGVKVLTGGAAASARMGTVKHPPAARADIDKVIEVFCNEFVGDDPKGEYFYWWPRSMWTDPNELIADDDEGGLHRVPFRSSPDQVVTFAEPIEVLETFVDVPAPAKAAAILESREVLPAATFTARSETPLAGRERPAAGTEGTPPKGGSATSANNSDMDPVLLRKALGLDAEATDEQLNAAVAAAAAGQEDPPADPPADPPEGDGEGEDTPPAEDGDGEGDGEGEDTPPADPPAAASGSTVTMDAEAIAELRHQASEGAAARAEQVVEAREGLLDTAVKAGKFPPARKGHWRELHQADAKGTEETLANLAAGLIPVEERGSSRGGDGDPSASGEVSEAEMRSMFPAFRGGEAR